MRNVAYKPDVIDKYSDDAIDRANERALARKGIVMARCVNADKCNRCNLAKPQLTDAKLIDKVRECHTVLMQKVHMVRIQSNDPCKQMAKWRCTDCGARCKAGVFEWRWNDSRWEHYHGEHIGWMPAEKLPKGK